MQVTPAAIPATGVTLIQITNSYESKVPPNQGLAPAQGQPTEQQQGQHSHPKH